MEINATVASAPLLHILQLITARMVRLAVQMCILHRHWFVE